MIVLKVIMRIRHTRRISGGKASALYVIGSPNSLRTTRDRLGNRSSLQSLRKRRPVATARVKSLALVCNTGANKTRLTDSGKTKNIPRKLGNPLKESLLFLPRNLSVAQRSITSGNLTEKRKKVQRLKAVRVTSSILIGLRVASKDKRMGKKRPKSS